MTTVPETAVKSLLTTPTETAVRPRYEGSNICTWIGFKHVNYMVEEAVLEHFRQSGLAARGLYEEYGLGLDIVALDTRILHAFHMDDFATAQVVPDTKATETDGDLAFRVTVRVERNGEIHKAVTSKVRVQLRIDSYLEAESEIPAELAAFAVRKLAVPAGRAPEAATLGGTGTTVGADDAVLAVLTEGRNAHAWKWNIGYPYCHFTERLQMSGYLRLMEEAKDRFVADRGISIKTLLDDRRWIPVVPHSEIRVLEEALMEEDLYTVYTVEQVFKDFTYTSRMDCYVLRDGELLRTATGTIVHGYAVIENRRDWSLVSLDERVLDAIRGVRGQVRPG